MTVIDNAKILGGRKFGISPEKRKAYGTIIWMARTYPKQVYDLLVKEGYKPQDQSIPALVRGMMRMIRSGNQAFMQDAVALATPRNSRLSYFDPSIITGAFAFLGNLFKSNPKEDITDELLELQKEKEKQAAMKNLVIFGGIALVGIISIVVLIRASK